ncbi:heme-binding protein [Streptomyces sp. NPDC005426]|uniref:GlcG/HbpS family heme-binding protein n=1 Tax=Streptomyces sp. NPDC005426 TaxID=3155344 RepID=UPI0033A28658
MKKMSLRIRVLTGAVATAALGAGTFGAMSANASAPAAAPATTVRADTANRNLQQSTHLTVDAATKAAQAALDAAEKENQRIAVSVVDRNGNTILTLRGDGSGPQAYESAEKKAYTAVSWNAPTSALAERLAQAPNLKDIPGTLFLAGGAPVQVKGAPVAGIGVAGAPSGDLDEKYARAGVAALAK